MPPKRGKRKAARSPSPAPNSSRSAEVDEAYHLFALPMATLLSQAEDDNDEGMEQQLEEHSDQETLLKTMDVRRALKSLNLPPPPSDFFEAGQKFLTRSEFIELAETLSDMERQDQMDVDETGRREAQSGKKAKAKQSREEKQKAEVDHAFALFTTPIPSSGKFAPNTQQGRRITLADLKRIARELREDVDDSVLKMMLLEANGAEGDRGVGTGVGREDFENVMKRAGVFA